MAASEEPTAASACWSCALRARELGFVVGALELGEDLAGLHLAAFLDAQIEQTSLDLRRHHGLAACDEIARCCQHGRPGGRRARLLHGRRHGGDLDLREAARAAPGVDACARGQQDDAQEDPETLPRLLGLLVQSKRGQIVLQFTHDGLSPRETLTLASFRAVPGATDKRHLRGLTCTAAPQHCSTAYRRIPASLASRRPLVARLMIHW